MSLEQSFMSFNNKKLRLNPILYNKDNHAAHRENILQRVYARVIRNLATII